MSGNTVYRFNNAAILSVVAVDAPEVVTSDYFDEQLAPTLARLGVRAGMLQQLAGIEERRWWPEDVSFTGNTLLGVDMVFSWWWLWVL